MKAEYVDVMFNDGEEVHGDHKTIELPFRRASTRGIIVRRGDGAVIGTQHQEGFKYAFPGGAIDNGESAQEALLRELEEENIKLVGIGPGWENRIAVDYFPGYHELSVWYIIDVEDAEIGECDENIESRWVLPHEDLWHPGMREKMLLHIKNLLGEVGGK